MEFSGWQSELVRRQHENSHTRTTEIRCGWPRLIAAVHSLSRLVLKSFVLILWFFELRKMRMYYSKLFVILSMPP